MEDDQKEAAHISGSLKRVSRKVRKRPAPATRNRTPGPRTEAFRLLKIISRSFEPDVRAQIVAEVRRHTDSDDPVFLANWLRHTFMTWLPNVPTCECGSVMIQSSYVLVPGSEQAMVADPSIWTGYRPTPGPDTLCRRIERSVCPECHSVRVASRENDPLVILRTRTGRCGEFAILFTSIMLALGHHSRLMFTRGDDHLWNETYVNGAWRPIDVSAPDVGRLIVDRYLFQKWGWKLKDLYAIEPGKLPVLAGERYLRTASARSGSRRRSHPRSA